MVTVQVQRNKGNIVSISIKGHADSAPKGQDLVCAGVSSIGVGLLNALDELVNGSCEFVYNDAIEIRVVHSSKQVQTILQTGLIQLLTIEEQYKDYIQVIKQEV